jgi:hypothetical protein
MAVFISLSAAPFAGAASVQRCPDEAVAVGAGALIACPRVFDRTPPQPPSEVEPAAMEVGVSITWKTNNQEPDFAGFNIYLYRNGGKCPRKLNCYPVKDCFFYSRAGAAGDLFAVRSVDTSGNESQNPPVEAAALPDRIVDFLHPTQNQNPDAEYSDGEGDWPVVPGSYMGTNGGSIKITQDDGTCVNAAFKGLWAFEKYEDYDGQLIVCNDQGASLEVTFYGRSVKLVSARYWTCGMCQVYLDGRFRGTFNLQSEETQYGYTVLLDCSLRPGYHTIKLVNPGIAVTPFNAQYGFHFVVFDYLVIR